MKKLGYLKLKKYLTIDKIKIAPNSLDPNVFYFPETGQSPILHPSITSQITNDVEMFVKDQPQRIEKYVLVGKALQPGNTDKTSPLKVLLILNKKLMDLDIDGLLSEEILKLANQLSNRLAIGTLRPIIYIPTIRDLNKFKNYSEIYDIFTQKWIKLPSNLKC